MQTCSKCNASSPDAAASCFNCSADLSKFSTTSTALMHMKINPRISTVRITVAYDACPHCYELLNTYPKDQVPQLPHEGCSRENGCRCFYEPVLAETAVVSQVVK